MLLAQFGESGIRAAAQAQINTTGGMWHLGDAEVIVPAAVTTIAKTSGGVSGQYKYYFQAVECYRLLGNSEKPKTNASVTSL